MSNAPRDCPVCGNGRTVEFLHRGGVPVHQNMLVPDRAAARAFPKGDLSLRACEACGFVFNAAFDPALTNYRPEYDNTQTCSPAFVEHVDGLVRSIAVRSDLQWDLVIEVGCGKGDFLRRLVGTVAQARGLGFDPAYVGPEVEFDGRLRFVRAFFDERTAPPAADVVICRHVIEHVPDPVRFLAAVRAALTTSPGARVFFETPCVEWILRNRVVWDFFYEHCSLFSPASLARAFERAGFTVVGVRHVFGGQYLWLEARPISSAAETVSSAAAESPRLAHEYQRVEQQRVVRWSEEVERLRTTGRVAVWGAGAKGVTLCNLIDPGGERLAAVVDVNPAKQGHYIAGTGHAIVAPDRLRDLGVRSVLVLNPNYVDEIERDLATRRLDVRAVDLMGLA
jgi:SAM-dependent methyltransferase